MREQNKDDFWPQPISNGITQGSGSWCPQVLVGVDEVGRGPLAGPVTVGVVALSLPYEAALYEGVRDSKQLSAPARQEWYRKLREHRSTGALRFAVASSSNKVIDKRGIVFATHRAIVRAFRRLALDPASSLVLLDAGLSAPAEFEYQRSIIRGDARVPAIALASIAAKVTRDRYMARMAGRYPQYGFEQHKGYGTTLHRERLRHSGLCSLHRRSFLGA